LFINLTPFVPLSFKGEGEETFEGASPLQSTPDKRPSPIDRILERLSSKGIKRGKAPLRISLPSPLIKGRGIKGEGLLNNLYCRG